MNLLELVQYFRTGNAFSQFYSLQQLNEDSEVIEIFMNPPLELGKPLRFFEIEKTEGAIIVTKDSTEYQNLFDFFYFLETLKEADGRGNYIPDEKLAEKILRYTIYDA